MINVQQRERSNCSTVDMSTTSKLKILLRKIDFLQLNFKIRVDEAVGVLNFEQDFILLRLSSLSCQFIAVFTLLRFSAD